MPPVALFVTCVIDLVSPDTGFAAARLLEAAGCDVEFPAAQTCCGQPALSAGEPEAAARLARHFVETFEPYETIVAPSGSCPGMVRHWYPQLLEGSWRTRAEAVAGRTYELAQYLVEELGRADLGVQLDATVTVHDSCHLLRSLGVRDASRVLLEAAGASVVEMVEAETCCGFGGTFGVGHGVLAGALADDKLGHAAATGASCLVACDQACLLHLEGRRRRGTPGPAPTHLADLLAGGLR